MCPVAFADMPVTAKVVWTNPLQQVQQEFSPLRSAERTSEARLSCASLSLMRLVTCADRVPFVDFPKVDLNPDMVHFPKRKGLSLPWGSQTTEPFVRGLALLACERQHAQRANTGFLFTQMATQMSLEGRKMCFAG